MPTYQYKCTECGQPTEAVQSFTDDALTVCPHCGGLLRKSFGSVGVVFKGTGFYRNDSRNGKTSTEPAASSSTTSDSGSSSTPAPAAAPAKTDKPAAKPASTPAASS